MTKLKQNPNFIRIKNYNETLLQYDKKHCSSRWQKYFSALNQISNLDSPCSINVILHRKQSHLLDKQHTTRK